MSAEAVVWDGVRPLSDRLFLHRREIEGDGLSLMLATENVRSPTDWTFDLDDCVLVVHLGGTLRRLESVFSVGPSSDALPAIGDIRVIPAGCRYAALAVGDEVSFAAYKVSPGLLQGGSPNALLGHRDPFLHQASIKAAALAERDDDLARLSLQALMTTLRFHIAESYPGPHGADGRKRPERARPFSERQKRLLQERIADAAHEPLGVDELARLAAVSPSQLSGGFKATFGLTPWQYVLRVRLARARSLLDSSARSVTDIAIATGFASASHFSTSFRKYFGLAPAAYRRTQQAEAGAAN